MPNVVTDSFTDTALSCYVRPTSHFFESHFRLAGLFTNNDNPAMNGNRVTSTILEAPSDHGRPEDKDKFFKDGFVRLPPRTHDISFTDSHIPSIERLGADLDAAVQAVWPKRHGIKYSQAHVLLLSWQADDLRVEEEILGLQHVFRDRFNFQVEAYQIQSLKPDKALKRRVLDFLDFDGKDALLVVYYGGHARRGLHSTDSPIWFANRDNLSISLPSGGIQSMLEEADADVLLLFDCCHSAAVATKDSLQGKGGVTEVIAACGYETIAAAVDEHSFTKSLTETLAVASKGSPFSVGELHSRVLRKLKCWTPCLERANDGRYIDEPDGRLRLEHQPRRTPIYSIVSESLPRRSIVLAPLPQPASSPKINSDSDLESSSSSPAESTPSQSDSSAESSCGKRKRPIPDDGPCAQILLAIRVDREVDIQAFTEWIRDCPPQGREIHVEGKYDSFSTLLILRIPVAVWSLLPENPAYTFVGFVTSGNQESASIRNVACECTSRRQCSICERDVQLGNAGPGAAEQDEPTRGDGADDDENKEFAGRKKLKGKGKEYSERHQTADNLLSMDTESQPNQKPVKDSPAEPAVDNSASRYNTSLPTSSSLVKDLNPSQNTASPRTLNDTVQTMSVLRITPAKAADNSTSPSAYTGSPTPQRQVLSDSNTGKDSSTPTEQQKLGQGYSSTSASAASEPAAGSQRSIQQSLDHGPEKSSMMPTISGERPSSLHASYTIPQASHIDRTSASAWYHSLPKKSKYEYVYIWTCCRCDHGGMTTDVEQCPNSPYTCGHVRCAYCTTESHKRRKESHRC